VSISLGGFMELLGSLAGFWQYRYGEPLAVCFALSWAINSFAVHGLPSLFGVDISACTDLCIDQSDIEKSRKKLDSQES
jgi:hypothetical protein